MLGAMRAANRVKLERQADHVILRFSVATDDSAEGEPVESILLPISAAGPLAFNLFEAVFKSAEAIQAMYGKLNELNEKLQGLKEAK